MDVINPFSWSTSYIKKILIASLHLVWKYAHLSSYADDVCSQKQTVWQKLGFRKDFSLEAQRMSNSKYCSMQYCVKAIQVNGRIWFFAFVDFQGKICKNLKENLFKYILRGVEKTWGRPWPTLWPTLWPTGGQI